MLSSKQDTVIGFHTQAPNKMKIAYDTEFISPRILPLILMKFVKQVKQLCNKRLPCHSNTRLETSFYNNGPGTGL